MKMIRLYQLNINRYLHKINLNKDVLKMLSQIKSFIIPWLLYILYIGGYNEIFGEPTTISPFLNLLTHVHTPLYNPLINQLPSQSLIPPANIPLHFISPTNNLHLTHHFNHLLSQSHEQYLNNIFGSPSDFNHHLLNNHLVITTTMSVPTISQQDDIGEKLVLNKNESTFQSLLQNIKLNEKDKEVFLKNLHSMIEIELNKRKQEKRKVIKTTNSDVNERNLEEFVVTEKPKIHASTTVNSKELLENLDEVSKAIEQFLDTEEVVIENLKSDNERQINTVEKSLPMNEEEIDDHLKSEERKNTSRKEENYKVNEQNEFDRFIKSKIKNLNEEISSTTTTTIEEKNEKTTTTLPELLIADYRRRIPVRYRYNTEFEKLAHDYQERLMMAGGIEDVFKILRNAKIALYSSPKISSKNNNN